LDSNEPGCTPLRSANATPSADGCSPSIGPTFPSTPTCEPSEQLALPLSMSSAAGGHVRTSRSPARAPDWQASDQAYGRSSPESLARFDPSTASWRTSQLCLDGEWETFSATWPRSGTMRSGTAYRLQPLVPLTAEIESGSWLPTPTGQGGGGSSRSGDRIDETPTLDGMARKGMWPTPSASSYGSSNNGCPGDGREVYAQAGKPSLETMARHNLWPTPQARDGRAGQDRARATRASSDGGDDLVTAVSRWPTPTAGDAKDAGSRNTATSKAHPGISLTDAVRADGGRGRRWPTPVARDAESLKKVTRGQGSMDRGQEQRIAPLAIEVMRRWPSPAARDYRSGQGRSDNGHTPQLPEQVGGQLNPTWVEWLMGLPLGWTVVSGSSPSATRSSRRSRRSSDAPS
jgi:hypothetical protein